MRHIDPVKELGNALLSVENPARYLGGETGQCIKQDADFTFTIAFPDVYEIGMSNQAIKILYNGLNALTDVRCERVFAPETDFEDLLKKHSLPLYTLESGIPLHETDIIGFSMGYELGITGVLQILDCGRVPPTVAQRTQDDPVIIAGGCGVTNPTPFADFFDAVFIGEAENSLFDLIQSAAQIKKRGAGREGILQLFREHPAVWMPGKKTVRAVQSDFSHQRLASYLPLPSIKVIQNHGVVEIMRGCPNGCRFCHAGIYYRPQRIKSIDRIIAETDDLVFNGGYREISLSSLSSGDYENVDLLLDTLNERYKNLNVSFQLPSLKVNSFTLPIVEKISAVRKSGLTFAVETPVDEWQRSLNKEVDEEKIESILLEAKKRGWNKAKFYFMIGLPVEKVSVNHKSEEEEIVDFMIAVQNLTRMQCTVNVGTFIPKPHTPYERVRQLSPEEAEEKLYYIRSRLPRGRFKVSTHAGFSSFLEGMMSRGDKNTGAIILEAYKNGCRLDAWENHLHQNESIWKQAMQTLGFTEEQVLRERSADEILPWNDVSLGVSNNFLVREWKLSQSSELTKRCYFPCKLHCGVCDAKTHVDTPAKQTVETENPDTVSSINCDDVSKNTQNVSKKILFHAESVILPTEMHESTPKATGHMLNLPEFPVRVREMVKKIQSGTLAADNIPVLWRVLFQFEKSGSAAYIAHLSLVEVFLRAFTQCAFPVLFTAGFNPIPRFELANSLSLGIQSQAEIASCLLRTDILPEQFTEAINAVLPDGLRIKRAQVFPVSNKKKRESLAGVLWGASYEYVFSASAEVAYECVNSEQISSLLSDLEHTLEGKKLFVTLPFNRDRPLRDAIGNWFGSSWQQELSIKKTACYAIDSLDYFTLFSAITKEHESLMQS